jgi:hypothetical protein
LNLSFDSTRIPERPSAVLHRSAALPVLALLTASVYAAFSQSKDDAKAQSQMKKQFTARMEQVGPVTEQQKLLLAFAGKFDLRTEVQMGPGQVMKAHGLAEGKAILGGRFVKFESTAAPDEELKGERINVYGYDTAAGKFTLWGVESMNNYSYSALGDYDSTTRTFKFEGEQHQADGSAIPFRWLLQVQESGALTQKISMKFPGAPDYAPLVNVSFTPLNK